MLALVVGAIAIWLIRQPWAAAAFWPWLPLILAMVSGAIALGGLERWLPGEPISPRLAAYPGARRRAIGIGCMGAGLTSAAWVIARLWPDYSKWHGTPGFWLGALALMLIGAWLLGGVGRGSPRAATATNTWIDSRRNRWLELAAFTLIFILAVFLRTYRLDSIPPGIFVDETNGGLDALQILSGRDVSPFTTGWYETPNGYIYFMAGIFRLFGASWFGLKLVSLIPAILTIPAVYLLGRMLFGPTTALIAMLLMAVSRWHLTMSRWGWAEVAPPVFQVLSVLFLVRGLRDRRALDYALSGLLAGLAVYTYLSSRLAAATLVLYVIYWFASDPSGWRAALRRSWLGIVVLSVTALVTVAPLGVTYVRNPFVLNNRVSEINIFRDVANQHSLAPVILNVVDMLRFFHQRGDLQGRHNLPGEPMTDPFTGLLFALGVAYALHNMRDQRRVLLLLWLLFGLAGSFLSSRNESPQAFRSLTALPAVVLLAADVLERISRALYGWLRSRQVAATYPAWPGIAAGTLAILVTAGAAAWETKIYFGAQAESIAVLKSFSQTETDVAYETIAGLEAGKTVYLSPTFAGFSPVRFLSYGALRSKMADVTLDNPPYHAIVPEVALPLPDDGHDTLLLLDRTYWPVRGFIGSLYPGAQMELTLISDGSPNYMRVQIEHGQMASLQGLSEDLAYADGHHESRVVPTVSAEGIDPGVSQVVWAGAIRLEHGGQYELRAGAGLQIFLDGEPMDGQHYLGSGVYGLRVVGGSNSPPSTASLSWKIGDSNFTPVPPEALFRSSGRAHGLLASYWDNTDWQGQPAFHQIMPFLLLAWPDEQPIVPNGPFSARFTGALHIIDMGAYQFRVEADDGARLTIDGNVLGEGLTLGQPNSFDASTNLTAGDHPIQVDYVQQGGGSALRLLWRRPQSDWTPVPPEVLIPAQP